MSGLADRLHSGTPASVSKQDAERLLRWARDAPLTLTALKARHEAAGGIPVHLNTLKALFKGGWLSGSASDIALRKRDNVAFEQVKQEIVELKLRAQTG